MNAKLLAQPENKKPLTINRDALKLAHEKVVDSYINSYLLAGARGLSTKDIVTLAEAVKVITDMQSAEKAPRGRHLLSKFMTTIGVTALVATNLTSIAPLSVILLTASVTGYSTLKWLNYEDVNDRYQNKKSQNLGLAVRQFNEVFSKLPENCKQDDRCMYVASEIREAIKQLKVERLAENFENTYSRLHDGLSQDDAFTNPEKVREAELLRCALQMVAKDALATRLNEQLSRTLPKRSTSVVLNAFSNNRDRFKPATLLGELMAINASIAADADSLSHLIKDYLGIDIDELGLNDNASRIMMATNIKNIYEKSRSASLTENYSFKGLSQ